MTIQNQLKSWQSLLMLTSVSALDKKHSTQSKINWGLQKAAVIGWFISGHPVSEAQHVVQYAQLPQQSTRISVLVHVDIAMCKRFLPTTDRLEARQQALLSLPLTSFSWWVDRPKKMSSVSADCTSSNFQDTVQRNLGDSILELRSVQQQRSLCSL